MSTDIDRAVTNPTPSEGSDAAAPESRRPQVSRGSALAFLERFGLLLLLGIALLVFSLLRPDTFATAANWRAIATSQSVLAVAAMALIVPLIGGRFDVSV